MSYASESASALQATRDEMSSARQARREISSLLQATRDAREDELGKREVLGATSEKRDELGKREGLGGKCEEGRGAQLSLAASTLSR